ncbi:E3 ubiquitin protein ligase DRIP2-like [Andrographis paniculata]|uniref:E3 ubiquitin protein ligase DRIP2-like n=1 Tax=Andrographis paniculata TaxID=175694 RepID=UPI0021E83FD5|nr:E3 ubiquitin protein ligase DRIP2-like [Andrographis paniculata]XP_051118619.1 E3 ubiquitin protein ligase DRIP2-like [Andrographis paniculata]
MSHQVVKVKRDAVAPCMTCPLCHKLLHDATTVIECLHTFCRKCIYKKLSSDEEEDCCPICNIHLGCVPLEKLRADHKWQDVRSKIFPSKRINARAPEVETAITLPSKRKERSLSSLVVSTPRVSTQNGLTGRRSKSTTRKASKGTRITMEKPSKREDSMADHPESSDSPEPPNKLARNAGQSYGPGELSERPSPNGGKENGYEAREGDVALWKPLNCLLEAANRSKYSNFSNQGSASKSEAPHDNVESSYRTKNKVHGQRSKVPDEKTGSDNTPPPSEKFHRTRPKKPRDFGEFRLPPQVVLNAASAKFDRANYPIWFSLISDERNGDVLPLPQIAANFVRIKDGNMPVSLIQKYLKMKLALIGEDEVEIKCMGQTVIPTLTMRNLVDLWLQTTTSDRVSAQVGSSAKEFVMVLGYARRVGKM